MLIIATTDSFGLHGFIDRFNHHVGHTALLQSNATFQLFIKILVIVSKTPVSNMET